MFCCRADRLWIDAPSSLQLGPNSPCDSDFSRCVGVLVTMSGAGKYDIVSGMGNGKGKSLNGKGFSKSANPDGDLPEGKGEQTTVKGKVFGKGAGKQTTLKGKGFGKKGGKQALRPKR